MSKTKPRIRELIVVEGRYDKNTVSQVVDALIFETGGFSLFNSPARIAALRRLAEERGVILFTDSDGAGFVIRGKLKGILPNVEIKNAFIPELPGKKKRKEHASRQGLLGVEGMRPEVIIEALRKAGATIDETVREKENVTTADFYALGLTGKTGSAELRAGLAESLNLPKSISQSDLRRILSETVTREELADLVSQLTET